MHEFLKGAVRKVQNAAFWSVNNTQFKFYFIDNQLFLSIAVGAKSRKRVCEAIRPLKTRLFGQPL